MKNIHTLMQYNKNCHIRNKYKKKTIQQHTSHFTLRQKKADVTSAQRYSSPSDKVRWHLNHPTKTTLSLMQLEEPV